MTSKLCRPCGRTLALTDFYRDKKAKDGRQYRCKDCQRMCVREWQDNNHERYKGLVVAWKAKNADRAREHYRESKRRERAQNPERFNTDLDRARSKSYARHLRIGYIRGLLIRSGFPRTAITEDIAGLKTMNVRVRRLLKEKSK